MEPIQLLGNLTIVSVFHIILVQQNYQNVNFYSNSSQNEIFNKIIQVASDSMKPFEHMNIDKIKTKQGTYGIPVLNILALSEINEISGLNKILYGTTVIWLTSKNENIICIESLNVTQLGSKVIILTSSSLFAVNNLVEPRFHQINLSTSSYTKTDQFLKNFFSIKSIIGSNITIFTEFNAPNSELTRIDDSADLYLIGPDAIIAEAFVNWLSITPTYSSSVGIKHPKYQEWLNSSVLSPRLRYQYYHSKVMTKSNVTIFDHNLKSRFDVQLTSFPHQGRNFTKRLNLPTESLYPHDTDCITAIVPQQATSNDFLRKTLKYADTQAICVALLLFIILRIFLQKATWQQGFKVLFETVSVFLNQSKIENDNQVKVAWDINLRAFSLLATTTLSAIIFKNMVATDRIEIDTLNHLLESNLTLYAPNYLKNQDIWIYMRSSLRSKIKFKTANDMQDDLVDKQKFNIGYIYHRAKGEYLIMLANSKVQPGSRNRVRLMKDQIHCGLASYRIYENSPLTPYVNVFLRRFSENGLYEKQLEWMQNLNQAVFQVKQNERNKREVVVLTGNMISGVFFIYLVGIGTATFSFGIEITFGFYYPLIFHKYTSN